MSFCSACSLVQQGKDSFRFIHDFQHTILYLGEHQYYKGYSVLFLKSHVRDLVDLDSAILQEMMKDLVRSARAIEQSFSPWKLNYGCYGNQVPHIHWHIFPRYEQDPDLLSVPWKNVDRFSDHLLSPQEAPEIIEIIKENL